MHDRIKGIEVMYKEFGGQVSIAGWVEGPLALGQELRGLSHCMTDFLDDPVFMKNLLDFTAEVAVVYAEAQIQAGVDTIGMCDAACSPELCAFLHYSGARNEISFTALSTSGSEKPKTNANHA
jgi:uroporphyrinogen-III decarboxylase